MELFRCVEKSDKKGCYLILDQEILDLVGYDMNTTVKIKKEDKKLILTPVSKEEKVKKASEKLNKKYKDVFRKLA